MQATIDRPQAEVPLETDEIPPLVAIGCPVRNRAWVLPEYLAALSRLAYGNRSYVFLENDSTDDTPFLLSEFAHRMTEDVVICSLRTDNPPGHHRGDYDGRDGYAHLARIRNRLLEIIEFSDAEYFLSVDSDVIVPPNLLEMLMPYCTPTSMVAAAISNQADHPLDGRMVAGNFLRLENGINVHPYSLTPHSPDAYPLSGVATYDVVGACVLMHRSVIEGGARYGVHPQGEDAPFCEEARANGVTIWVSFDVRPEHRMIETPAKQ